MFWDNAEETEQNQRSSSWIEWRKNHLGASEIPALMGTCDFSDELGLWLKKTEKELDSMPNAAMQRGIDAEPKIRELYERRTGHHADPIVMEHPEYPFLSASLDGWVVALRIVVEYKYPSKEKHQIAIEGAVPETYRDQLQAQLLVSGGVLAHYVSYDGSDIVIVDVFPDKDRQGVILNKSLQFWHNVKTNTPPISDDILMLKQEEKALKARISEIKKRIDFIKSTPPWEAVSK